MADEADAPNEDVQKVIESERAEAAIHASVGSVRSIDELGDVVDSIEDDPVYRGLMPSKASKMQKTLRAVRAASQSDSLRGKGKAEADLVFSAISSQNA